MPRISKRASDRPSRPARVLEHARRGATARLAAAALLASLASAAPQAGRQGEPPNFLVILADDIGIDNLRAYRAHPAPARTKNLDRLARESLLFDRAYANPLCSPTRAALLTGQYGWRTKLGRVVLSTANSGGLDDQWRTIPDALGASYRSVALGKWHLSDKNQIAASPDRPLDHGFDDYALTFFNLNSDDQSYDRFLKYRTGQPARPVHRYATTDTIDDAIGELQAATKPLFLYVALHAPHSPWHDPPAHLHTVDTSSGTNEVLYKAMVEAMDTEIGRLLEALEQSTLADNTYVFFIGDNGTAGEVTLPPWDPEHAKGSPYEGGTRVPFLVSGPGIAPHRNRGLVQVTDVFATLAELAGVPSTAPDSVSLVPYFQGPVPGLRQRVYTETFSPNASSTLTDYERAARGERYKVIEWKSARDEMYDLWVDPLERNDLLAGGVAGLSPDRQLEYRALKEYLELNGGSLFK